MPDFVQQVQIRDTQKVWAALDVGAHWVSSTFITLPLSEKCQNRKKTSILPSAIAAQEPPAKPWWHHQFFCYFLQERTPPEHSLTKHSPGVETGQHSPCSGCILWISQLAEHTSHITPLLAGELELTSDLKFPRNRWKKDKKGTQSSRNHFFVCVAKQATHIFVFISELRKTVFLSYLCQFCLVLHVQLCFQVLRLPTPESQSFQH